MKIFYSPETDSLSIKLRTGDDRVLGEIMGEDLNENVTSSCTATTRAHSTRSRSLAARAKCLI